MLLLCAVLPKLRKILGQIGDFSETQIEAKENYRTFHDWLLVKVLGEEWLSNLTSFIMSADRPAMEEQIEAIKKALQEAFEKNVPDIREKL